MIPSFSFCVTCGAGVGVFGNNPKIATAIAMAAPMATKIFFSTSLPVKIENKKSYD
jgi:hypothetical protein